MDHSITVSGDGVFATAPGFVAVLFACFWVLLHIALAMAVTADIRALHASGRESKLLGSLGWAYFTLLSGPLGFAYYWVVHHSSLRDQQADVRTPGGLTVK
jgi:hypothetical protein